MGMYDARIARVRERMALEETAAVVVTPSSDLFYLSGLALNPSQRIVCLVVTQTRLTLFAPAFELSHLQTELSELVCEGWQDAENPIGRLSALLPRTGCIALGREMKAGWVLALQSAIASVQWRNADSILAPLRRVKDAHELAILSHAQQMAESALQKLFAIGLQGRTEREISKILMQLRLDEGFASVGAGIVASGPNSACPHHQNTDRKVQAGDALMLDIGGEYMGYRADMTRTVAIGHADEPFREIYGIVLQAHLAVLQAVRPGVCAQAVDNAARSVIAQAGYAPFFTHRLGHGIGIDVHEEPFISESATHLLEPGNVFSDEPGIYLPGRFGVRIEDLLAVTDTGAQLLNQMGKELLIVD